MPQVSRYRGNKMLAQDAIQTKKVFGFNAGKQQLPKTDAKKSRSPYGFGAKTPTRRSNYNNTDLNKSATNITPTRQTGTASKLNTSQQATTARKYPMTTKR